MCDPRVGRTSRRVILISSSIGKIFEKRNHYMQKYRSGRVYLKRKCGGSTKAMG